MFVFKRQLPCAPPPSPLTAGTQQESLGCLLLKQELSREALARSEVSCTDVWRRPRMKGISAMIVVTQQNLLVRDTNINEV